MTQDLLILLLQMPQDLLILQTWERRSLKLCQNCDAGEAISSIPFSALSLACGARRGEGAKALSFSLCCWFGGLAGFVGVLGSSASLVAAFP